LAGHCRRRTPPRSRRPLQLDRMSPLVPSSWLIGDGARLNNWRFAHDRNLSWLQCGKQIWSIKHVAPPVRGVKQNIWSAPPCLEDKIGITYPLEKVGRFYHFDFRLRSGRMMSPGLDARFPCLLDLFGGRQTARSIHFMAAFGVVLFREGYRLPLQASVRCRMSY